MTAHRNAFRRAPLAAAVLLAFARALPAATIAVDDASQSSVAGKCTLLDAVAALNTASAVHACAAGDGNNDTIDFSFFTGPTAITFTALPADGVSALPLSKPVKFFAPLDASGNPLVTVSRSTVSGTPAFRLIATASDLSIDGLALSGGSSPDKGGAVFVDQYASASIVNAVISNNAAATSGGGISVDCGNLTVVNSRITGNTANRNGGGIYGADDYYSSSNTTCMGTVTLNRSTLSGNTATTGSGGGAYLFKGYFAADLSTIDANAAPAGTGGGVFCFGSMGMRRSTLSNNVAQTDGGGARINALFHATSSTILGNHAGRAGGGVRAKYCGAVNSTFFGNVAATGGAMEVTNAFATFSTITGNTAGQGAGVNLNNGLPSANSSFVATILQHNLTSEDLHGSASVNTILGGNSIIGTHSLPVPADSQDCDANLQLPANNGGPTPTIALAFPSCAMNAGPVSPPGTIPSDQRGAAFARRVGPATDIGAFEVQDNDRIFYDGYEG